MDTKPEVEITDEEIEALVAAVSDELGPLPDGDDDDIDDDDIDIDEKDVSTENKKELRGDATGQEIVADKAGDSLKIKTNPPEAVVLASTKQLKNKSAEVTDVSDELQSAPQSSKISEEKARTEPKPDSVLQMKQPEAAGPVEQTASKPEDMKQVINSSADRASDKSSVASSQTEVKAKPVDQKPELATGASRSDEPSSKNKGASPAKQKAEKTPVESSPSNGGGWGWFGGWGSAIVSSATAVTSHVGESLYHVLEKVEASLVEPGDEQATSEPLKAGKTEGQSTVEVEQSLASRDGGEVVSNAVAAENKATGETDTAGKANRDNLQLDLPSRLEPKLPSDQEKPVNTPSSDDGTGNSKENEEEKTGARKKRNMAKKKKEEFAGGGEVQRAGASDKSGQHQTTPGEDNQASAGWFTGWDFSPVTQLAGAVTKKGKKVVSTGFTAIGDIGKKTYHVLMEEDEEEESNQPTVERDGRKKPSGARKKQPSFSVALDDGSGEAHLEALQELSQWSAGLLEQQLVSITKTSIDVIRDDIAMIREAFNLSGIDDLIESLNGGDDRDHNFVQLVGDFVSQLGLNLDICRLMAIQQCTRDFMNELKSPVTDPKNVHQRAVKSLVELTAVAVALYHKVGQLLLVEGGIPLLAYKFRALSLAGLTKVLCMEVYIESNRFTSALMELASTLEDETTKSAVTSLSTMIELETSNCSCTLQDACACLLPIMQLVVVRVHPQLADSNGFAQLEALQMLSSMSRTNVREFLAKLPDSARKTIEVELTAVEAAFDLGFFQHDEDGECSNEEFQHRFEDLINLLVSNNEVGVDKVIATQKQARRYASRDQADSGLRSTTQQMHQMAVKSLTDMTAETVSLFYSLAQLTLTDKPHRTKLYSQKAENLARLTKLVCVELGALSTVFTDNLSSSSVSDDTEAVTPFVTNIYLEASSCSTYIQDAFHLMLPVYQLTLVKAHSWFSDEQPAVA